MKPLPFAIYGFLLLLASWAVAQAVDLTGTWKAQTSSARGTAEQTITFQQTGNSFTGEMTTSQGNKEPIKNGLVNGDTIEFNVERQQASGVTSLAPYKGTVKGDEITGTFTGATGREVDWTAKREKP